MATIINQRDVILQATSPRILPVTLPGNVTVPPGNLGGGTLPGGVTVPPGNLGNGNLPGGVTVPALQVTGTIQTNQLSASVITTGNLSAQNISANQITTGTLNTNRLNADVITTGNLYAQNITANQVQSGSFIGKTFTGGVFTGGIFQTAVSGPRIQIDGYDNEFSILGIDNNGSLRQFVRFDPSSSGAGNSMWGFQQDLPGLTVNGGACPALKAIAWRVNVNGTWADTFSPAIEGHNQSMGVGVAGYAENNVGVHARSISGSHAPLLVEPQSSLPPNKAAGSIIFHSGALCFSDGVNWHKITGTTVL